jgi:hypothetical protein
MKKQVFYTLIIIFLGLNSFAQINQYGRIKGLVVDKDNGDPIISANIKIVELPNIIVQSDNNGIYVITKIPYGKYTVRFAYIGYETKILEVDINNEEPIQLNFNVVKKKNQLKRKENWKKINTRVILFLSLNLILKNILNTE